MHEYKLIRSKRKTLSLYITADGLEARAPLHMPVAEIEKFILKKSGWISKHLRPEAGIVMPQGAGAREFALSCGDLIPLRGREYPIVSSASMNTGRANRYLGRFDGSQFLVGENLDPDELRFVLGRIYKGEAERYIPDRVKHFAETMGLSVESVRITSAFGRWGSCSARKRLNFSWLLMMADDDAIDSVIIHELSHITHPNHSKDFWALVGMYCPDYSVRKKDLNALSKWIRSKCWKE